MKTVSATLLLLIAAVIWGFTFVVQKWATQGHALPALTLVGIRFLLGGLLILPLAVCEQRSSTPRPARSYFQDGWFAACGAALFAASWLQQWGIESTSVSNAGFFTGVYVVLTPLVGWCLYRLRPSWLLAPGIGLTMVGIYLLNGSSLTRLQTGDALVSLGSVFWAVQITLVSVHVKRSQRPLRLACVQFITCGMLGLVGALLTHAHPFANLWEQRLVVLWTSVMSVAGAFTLQVIAQRHLSAAVAAIIMGSEMVFAAWFGFWFAGDQLSQWQWLGGALIFIAIVLVDVLPSWQTRQGGQASHTPR